MLKLCLHELIMRPFKRKSVIGPFPFGFTSILISSPPRSCGRLSSLATFGSQHRAKTTSIDALYTSGYCGNPQTNSRDAPIDTCLNDQLKHS